jgi:hypothetical protein
LFLQKQQTLVSLNIVFGRYCFKTQTVPGLENVTSNAPRQNFNRQIHSRQLNFR